MMKTTNTEGSELLPLLTASAITKSFMYPSRFTGGGCSAQEIIAAGILLFFPLWGLLAIYQHCFCRSDPSRTFLLLMAGTLMLSAAIELVNGQQFYNHTLGSHLSLFWFLALSLGVAAYGQSLREGALGRTAQLVLGIWLVSFVLLLASVTDRMHTVNLSCIPVKQIAFSRCFSLQSMILPEYLLLPVLADKPKAHPRHAGRSFWLPMVVFVLGGVMAVSSELVLGEQWQGYHQPIYLLARLGALSIFRRMDALHVCVWLMLFFLKIALYFWAIARIIQPVKDPHGRSKLFCAASAAVIMLFGLVQRYPSICLVVQQILLWILLFLPMLPRRERSSCKKCGQS